MSAFGVWPEKWNEYRPGNGETLECTLPALRPAAAVVRQDMAARRIRRGEVATGQETNRGDVFMVIVAALYAILVWLIFFRLKWLRWGWGTGTVTVILGMLLCAVFVGFLSYLAPTGRVTVISRVVEVTPNVSDQITEISVPPNRLVKADAVLFKIDPAPYQAQVRTIEAWLNFQELWLAQMKQLQASSSGRAFDLGPLDHDRIFRGHRQRCDPRERSGRGDLAPVSEECPKADIPAWPRRLSSRDQ